MARALPPLSWFRSFEASARNLSFTAAAEELGLTQSAISQQVRHLEQRLGVTLFQRQPRGLALTDDGRRLLPSVGRAIDGLRAATQAFEAGPTQDLVTVATSVSVAQWVIQPALSGFLSDHPDVRLRLVSTIWPDDFTRALADVEVRFGSAAQVGAGAEPFGSDRLIAVSRSGAQADLERLPLIEAVGVSAGWAQWPDPVPQAPRVHVDSYGAALDLAVQGVGAALTSQLLAEGPIARGGVRRIGETAMPGVERYFLACRSTAPAARAFAAWLQARA
ncbi:LysR family transcriptional regulator [Pseudaestuariivita atlantica]|uniref:LysR family transcriptional regulator n=1 Tax=Pseudaestuariivita atlantica TaxID=1317121 RepID=A0A0L1JNR4_9RHOB|nr:LysR family transcriptional regulator [Pseudaestuariivita atlantica]KNG93405.1 LysR family transcriptional regulator [Pseudaestuariivita atlantica]